MDPKLIEIEWGAEFLETDLPERAPHVWLPGQSGPLPAAMPPMRKGLFAAS